ncbi:MAG: YceI family protein [Chitinophagales bacterium]|nr:YceI family protein [Bacteroidota bacterium]MCB9044251.1 YceI family protein [Chitinophagales bacterium]
MNKKSFLVALFFIAIFAVSCKQQPESDKAKVEDAKPVAEQPKTSASFKVDPAKSTVTWIGSKPTGTHNGTIGIKKGLILVNDDNIVGGEIVLDMNDVKVVDLTGDDAAKLAGHLKSDDFFKSEKYPEAVFALTGHQPYTAPADESEKALLENATHLLTGNLTILDTSKSITFPAKISLENNVLTAQALFNIDRTDWGISYHAAESFGDKIISSQVTVGFNIVAQP